MIKKNPTKKLVVSAMLLAIAVLLPSITGNIPKVGNALCPMHIPVLLCGFICGWPWGLAVGFISPLLRSAMFVAGAVTTAIPGIIIQIILIPLIIMALQKNKMIPIEGE